jgi:hypothetical protein
MYLPLFCYNWSGLIYAVSAHDTYRGESELYKSAKIMLLMVEMFEVDLSNIHEKKIYLSVSTDWRCDNQLQLDVNYVM